MKYKDITYELIPFQEDTSFLGNDNRYLKSQVYEMGSEKFFETWDIVDIPFLPGDIYHKIEAGEVGRWDILSYNHYHTVLYWWVICLANNITNPLVIIPAGDTVRIPDIDGLRHRGIIASRY
jgi:hypothetical protein